MKALKILGICSVCLGAFLAVKATFQSSPAVHWSERELALINTLRIENLGPLPESPSNRFSDSKAAATLGKKIFFDKRFSRNGEISCASCHLPDYSFTDRLPRAKGLEEVDRRSMPLLGLAYQRWFFWDGRSDSLWAQALGPLENPREHGIDRSRVTRLVFEHYAKDYQSALGELPEHPGEGATEVFVNVGKSIAAFVRTIVPGPSSFDEYANSVINGDTQSLGQLKSAQKAGLRLFLGKGRCINCHNGPMFSNGEFHHLAVADHAEIDLGRAAVIHTLFTEEFGCLSQWSDAEPEECLHLRFLKISPRENFRAFKTPTLRNVAVRAPYMHAGQFADLAQVLKSYSEVAGKGPADELFHGELTSREQLELVEFLKSLTSDHLTTH
ncbi:Di-heme cytochrome c peroxidase family protein [marine gamma proteobacterium HTCC2148]|jgi:cytochrome c peroxidase|nr:Di-heme cytochrome c peroxidase family protein [marine gamma proteobacterium HTCC2148]